MATAPDKIYTKPGILFGWTYAEIEGLLAAFKAKVQSEGLDRVTSVSINGKNVGIGSRAELTTWMAAISRALSALDPDKYGDQAQSTTRVNFSGLDPLYDPLRFIL